jgi:putative ABC transport system permease protein
MAVGARDGDIRRQFLAEAVVLCLGGAVWGPGRDRHLARHRRGAGLACSSPMAVLAAAASAVVTGLVFGYYPALRASRQDPSRRSDTVSRWIFPHL